MDIILGQEVENWLDENEAFIVAMEFSTEAIQRALELAEEGYEMTLHDGADDGRLDYHYLSLTLWGENDEIEDQVVINTSLYDEEDES